MAQTPESLPSFYRLLERSGLDVLGGLGILAAVQVKGLNVTGPESQ